MIKTAFVIKSYLNKYLKQVRIPVEIVNGPNGEIELGCEWSDDIREAVPWPDMIYAHTVAQLWNVTNFEFCTVESVEYDEVTGVFHVLEIPGTNETPEDDVYVDEWKDSQTRTDSQTRKTNRTLN